MRIFINLHPFFISRYIVLCKLICYNFSTNQGGIYMKKHIKTVAKKDLKCTIHKGGCGECPTSCQSACKTSCTVSNQTCKN